MCDIYLSVDVESDGPIPGKNSMLSLGAVAIDMKKNIIGEFEVNLETLPDAISDPKTMDWWTTQPEAWAYHRQNLESPKQGMDHYLEWLKKLPNRPIFMGYPASYDFMFHHWYLIAYTGEDPCGFAALDMKSFAAGHLKIPFRKSAKRNYPSKWFENLPHDHKALTDARSQAIMGINLMRECLNIN